VNLIKLWRLAGQATASPQEAINQVAILGTLSPSSAG